jgi:purine-nucleoside phosphorylase
VVSAFAPELAALRRALRRLPAPAAAPVVSAPVGIGAVEAAIGAARALARIRPRAVLFVGTAGRYRLAPLATGEVAVARRLVLASTAAIRGDGYLPARLLAAARTDGRLGRALMRAAAAAGVRAARVDAATPLGITRDRTLAARLHRATGAAVENLEVFAVARAAAAAGVPFGAALGISNRVGPGAHAEWREHQHAAAAAACAVVERYLRASALKAPSRR